MRKIDTGDKIIISEKKHPLHGCRGMVVGRRGNYRVNDPWLLVVMEAPSRTILIPESMVKLENCGKNDIMREQEPKF